MPHRTARLSPPWLPSLLVLVGLATLPPGARAQVAPGGLTTRVNGTALGRCVAGICSVQGGAAAGANLFHRFSQFDTRSGIKRVDLDTRGRRNVVVGVADPTGSFFGAPLRLSENANLFWLSPGGIWLGQGAHFQGATNLLLTTAAALRFGNQWFDALGDATHQVVRLDQSPSLNLDQPDQGDGPRAALGGGGAPIVLAGGRLTIDRHLLLDSGAGPILSAPGADSMALHAGASLRLSGGRLDLSQLTASAGSAGEPGLIRLTATGEGAPGPPALRLRQARLTGQAIQVRGQGALALSDVELRAADGKGQGGDLVVETGLGGAAQLSNATLSGQLVAIRADGPLEARNLVIRAGHPTRPGGVHLQAGAGQAGGAPLRLENADLEGGEIQLRSSGHLDLSRVRADASSPLATGRIGLEAGLGERSTAGGIDLRQVRLNGSQIQVEARSGLRGTDVQALATPAGAAGRIWFLAGADGRGGSNAAIDLRDLLLRGAQITLQAPEGLKGLGWTVEAQATASTAGEILLLTGTSDPPRGGGIASLETARLTADRLQLRAGGGYSLKQVLIQARQGLEEGKPEGLIQLDTGLAPTGDAAVPERLAGGKGVLEAVDLAGQRIVVRAGEGLSLRNVSAQAGPAGARGLVWLEAGPGTQTAASVTLERTRVEGQHILMRADDLALTTSQLQAPKGVIHLEARGSARMGNGNLRVSGSSLGVGVERWEDLKRDLRFVQSIDGVDIVKTFVPSIALFASGTIDVGGASQLTATQDFSWIPASAADDFKTLARLADTSGVILLDAQQSVRVKQSTLRADATHTLAGDVVLRSQATSGSVGVQVEAATITASGGAGAGDLRLRSSNGITVQAGSVLEANSPNKPTPLLLNLYGGGGITLVNDSPQIPITIRDATLRAQQFTGGGSFSPLSLDGGTGKEFDDPFDDADRQRLHTQGGAITLLSTGGIRIEGADALLAVDSKADDPKTSEAFGGVVRLINTRQDTPIEIVNKATLRLDVKPVASTPELLAGKPELQIWNQGPIRLDQMTVSAKNELGQAGERFNPLITLASNRSLNVSRSTFALTSSTDAGDQKIPDLAFQVTSPDAISLNALEIVSGKHVFNPAAFVTSITPEQFEAIRPPASREGAWHRTEYLYLKTSDNVASDPWLDGGDDVDDPIPKRIALQATPAAASVRVFRPGNQPLAIQPLSPGLPAPQTDVPSASPMALARPPRSLETVVPGQSIRSVGPAAARLDRKLAMASVEPPPRATAAGPSGPSRALGPREAEDALLRGEEIAAQSLLAAASPHNRSKRLLSLPTLQEALRASVGAKGPTLDTPRGRRAGYAPAILRINVSPPAADGRVQMDHILIPASGEIRGWRTLASRDQLRSQIKTFQRTLSQQLPPSPEDSARALAHTLLDPILPDVERLGINALLLSLDRELQSIPFSALPMDRGVLGDKVALTVTPTLRLTDLGQPVADPAAQTLLAGATRFRNGLAPLPMARQELEHIAALLPGSPILLDDDFSLGNLRGKLKLPTVSRLHLATHADFRVDDSQSARLYTASGELKLSELGRDLQSRANQGLDLVVLSACRTALGDEDRELGIAGLALQTGSASALGTLWYVDDAAAAAFSIQFHHFLRQGLNKDQALQATQSQFRHGAVRVVSDQIVNAAGQPLVSGLSRADQARLEGGLGHPYYWAGMVLSGRPW